MTAVRRRFSEEFKDELCREAISASRPTREVAESCGVGPETLRVWLVKYRDANGGAGKDLTLTEYEYIDSQSSNPIARRAVNGCTT